MPRLRLIAMGGTIAFTDSPRGAVPSLGAVELAGFVQAEDEISSIDLAGISSIGLTAEHLQLLVGEIETAIADGYDGLVVSHGTDTLEESVYLAALTVARTRVPVVFTGAMRHHDAPGSDGAANLNDALAVARRGGTAGSLGPVVVMNGEIHAARFVSKQNTASLNAFCSPGAGPVGSVVEGRVSIWFSPTYLDFVGDCPIGHWPRVELVPMTTALDPSWLRSLVATDPDGVVLAGFGGGHAHTASLELLDELIARGVPIVAASRCGSGDTLRSTYGVPGTEIDLQERGVVMAGAISPIKARLRLAIALANQLPAAAVFPIGG